MLFRSTSAGRPQAAFLAAITKGEARPPPVLSHRPGEGGIATGRRHGGRPPSDPSAALKSPRYLFRICVSKTSAAPGTPRELEHRNMFESSLEWGFLADLLYTPEALRLVDELYIEMHFFYPSLWHDHFNLQIGRAHV